MYLVSHLTGKGAIDLDRSLIEATKDGKLDVVVYLINNGAIDIAQLVNSKNVVDYIDSLISN